MLDSANTANYKPIQDTKHFKSKNTNTFNNIMYLFVGLVFGYFETRFLANSGVSAVLSKPQ